MDIAPYIADLLRQHDEVNVPSLGTFYKKHKSGFFDTAKGDFYPPSHGLSLKEAEDDTLLATYISEQKNISLNTANYFIEKFVSQIQSDLAATGEAEIDSFGTLIKSKEGYSFLDELNFDDEGQYFGLQPVKELSTALAQPDEGPVQQEAANEEETVPEDTLLVGQTSEPGTEAIEEERQPGRSAVKFILAIAASVILLGIIAYAIYPQAFETFRQKTNVPEKIVPAKQPVQNTVPKTLADSLAQADTIYQELSKQGFEVEKPRDTLNISTTVEPVTTPSSTVTFEIIGAAFARRSEAETYVKQLNARGVYAKIVEDMPGSKLKISLGSFNDEALAQKELVRIHTDFNKEAWIARVKPKKTN